MRIGVDSNGMVRMATDRVLAAFRRAATSSIAYQQLLQESGVSVDSITELAAFTERCPVLTKENTFGRFALPDLIAPGVFGEIAEVLTSSGHGGRFSFGVITRRQMLGAGAFVDDAMDAAFQVKSRRTLAINCLPMGVNVPSERMTVARVSVRPDMAVGLIKNFGSYYDQVLVVSDPLFLPHLLTHAEAEGVEWPRYHVKVVVGEEFFGEAFRQHVAGRLGYTSRDLNDGVIMSSMGVGELGLHLFYETPVTISLRRYAATHPEFAAALFGDIASAGLVPMILAFDPARLFVEIDRPDRSGFGTLTMSILDVEAPVPLLRYQSGDLAAFFDPDHAATCASRFELSLAGVPQHLIALRGRSDDIMPGGWHVGVYREALFSDDAIASQITGAIRAETAAGGVTLHVQLSAGAATHPSLESGILSALRPEHRPAHVRVWEYERFPFGMRLDYERKFRYYEPAATRDGGMSAEGVKV
jgi:phenylacetate-CoA ligase